MISCDQKSSHKTLPIFCESELITHPPHTKNGYTFRGGFDLIRTFYIYFVYIAYIRGYKRGVKMTILAQKRAQKWSKQHFLGKNQKNRRKCRYFLAQKIEKGAHF